MKIFVGVDVGAKELVAARSREGKTDEKKFPNDDPGYRALVKWVGKGGRVCMEATGVYHLGAAMALRKAGIEVMVVNPRIAKDYARSMGNRSKTDQVDAKVLLDYVLRRDFHLWEPPRRAVFELRELGRRIEELVRAGVMEKNRLHAKRVASLNPVVVRDVRGHIEQIERRIVKVEAEALAVIGSDPDLLEQYTLLLGATGIGKRSAVQLLAELAVLDPTMTVRELVAHTGLDVRVHESGTSVALAPRISKVGNARVRRILYMVALSAIRYHQGPRSFYQRLIARGKKKMQAVVAVMRKILHGIWIVMQRRVAFDHSILFAASLATAESSDSAIASTQPEPQQNHPKGRSEAKELRQQLESVKAEATRPPKPRRAA